MVLRMLMEGVYINHQSFNRNLNPNAFAISIYSTKSSSLFTDRTVDKFKNLSNIEVFGTNSGEFKLKSPSRIPESK